MAEQAKQTTPAIVATDKKVAKTKATMDVGETAQLSGEDLAAKLVGEKPPEVVKSVVTVAKPAAVRNVAASRIAAVNKTSVVSGKVETPQVVRIKKGVVSRPTGVVSRPTYRRSTTTYRTPVAPVVRRPLMTRPICGMLDTFRENMPVLRESYTESENDAFVAVGMVRKYKLQPGDVICGEAREPKDNDRFWTLVNIKTVNGVPLDEFVTQTRVKFHQLTPVYPDEQIKLETGADPLSTRIIDLIAPIGKGQRSLIVSPPKAGKTSLLKEVSTGVAANYPDIHLMAVLIGERPEEVTDMRRHIEKITKGKGEVAASNFDETADTQCRVAELALERAKRLVEEGRDVVILLDSITRLARAYNLSIPTSGRTLSGGFDPAALFPPKKFFGAARNFEVAGSLTIVGTALVDTGSRMDDLVYEEFKGTGNQELHLDRRLAERRIYPAIEIQKSGTRRDDLLIDPITYQAVLTLQRMLDTLDKDERTVTLMDSMKKTKSNKEFLQSLRSA